jgi:hypothetical protein
MIQILGNLKTINSKTPTEHFNYELRKRIYNLHQESLILLAWLRNRCLFVFSSNSVLKLFLIQKKRFNNHKLSQFFDANYTR